MIPLPTLRTELRLGKVTTDDEIIRRYEAAAVAHVERETGRYFGPPVARTEYFVGIGQREIALLSEPTGAVTVTVNGAAVDATAFEVRGRRLRHTSGWGYHTAFGPADVVVTYTGGYAEGSEPADVREAVLLLVQHWYAARTAGTPAAVPETLAETVRNLTRAIARVAM